MDVMVWNMEMLKEQISAMKDNEMLMVEIVQDVSDKERMLRKKVECSDLDKNLKQNNNGHGTSKKLNNNSSCLVMNDDPGKGGNRYGR